MAISSQGFILAAGGGAIIGVAAVLMMWLHGRILGVSGLAAGLISRSVSDQPERLAFLLGALVVGAIVAHINGAMIPGALSDNMLFLVCAGLAVGFGTRLGSGCTSGHGVCGIARLSPRSITATAVFIGVAMLTVGVRRFFA